MIKFTAFVISIAIHALLITSLVLPEAQTNDSKSILLKLKPPSVEKIQKELPAEIESQFSEQIKKAKADTTKLNPDPEIKKNIQTQNVKTETSEKPGTGFLIDTPQLKSSKNEKIEDTKNSEPQNEFPNVTPSLDIDSIKRAYEQSILKKIDTAKSYPPLAVKRGKEGRVKVGFIVHSNGDISELKISSKAPFSAFNDAVLKAVNDATPFDSIPPELNISQMKISVWVSFNLNSK
ncbi:energy transducer TonB [bacterium]|nr:energy transducer TonB [bacterium]MBU1025184.1 energy transducer TonB [bacterium]